MIKEIEVDGKKMKLKATAATPRLYRLKFRRDLITDLTQLAESTKKENIEIINLEIFENVAYIMAKQADDNIPDDINVWLDDFSTFAIRDILPHILDLWGANMETTVESKKKLREVAGN